MSESALVAAGGVGLFLLGMTILTDGLRRLAGSWLREALRRATRSPLTGAFAGAATTAVVQSSSATTVSAVGFVGAGILTFPQALGIVFGANVGTTVTGWLVALLGFKLDIGLIAPALLLVGALLRLFGKGRARDVGWALAGFSLLFIGVDTLQGALAGLEGQVTPDTFPDDSTLGRLQLVLIGSAITLVTQSSSAGVATTLAALGAGTISLEQAAALVIGMDVGTSGTALLASLGGSIPMRRTAAAHVLYNVFTASLAFALLTPFGFVASRLGVTAGDAAVAIVAFHSSFNVAGAALAIAAARPFARLVERLVPDHGDAPGARLDPALLHEPAAAIDAASGALAELARDGFGLVVDVLERRNSAREPGVASLREGLEAVRVYLEGLPVSSKLEPQTRARYVETLHVVDHLGRLVRRCATSERAGAAMEDRRIRRLVRLTIAIAQRGAEQSDAAEVVSQCDRLRRLLRRQRRVDRDRIWKRVASGKLEPTQAQATLDGLRWLHRVTYHLWRIGHHMKPLTGAPHASATFLASPPAG